MNNGEIMILRGNIDLLKRIFDELQSDPCVLSAGIEFRYSILDAGLADYFCRDAKRVGEFLRRKTNEVR